VPRKVSRCHAGSSVRILKDVSELWRMAFGIDRKSPACHAAYIKGEDRRSHPLIRLVVRSDATS
jgi:hypothetical protein